MTKNTTPTAEERNVEVAISLTNENYQGRLRIVSDYREEIEAEIREDERRKVIEEIKNEVIKISTDVMIRENRDGTIVVSPQSCLYSEDIMEFLSQLK